jgi:hypothetical protein
MQFGASTSTVRAHLIYFFGHAKDFIFLQLPSTHRLLFPVSIYVPRYPWSALDNGCVFLSSPLCPALSLSIIQSSRPSYLALPCIFRPLPSEGMHLFTAAMYLLSVLTADKAGMPSYYFSVHASHLQVLADLIPLPLTNLIQWVLDRINCIRISKVPSYVKTKWQLEYPKIDQHVMSMRSQYPMFIRGVIASTAKIIHLWRSNIFPTDDYGLQPPVKQFSPSRVCFVFLFCFVSSLTRLGPSGHHTILW